MPTCLQSINDKIKNNQIYSLTQLVSNVEYNLYTTLSIKQLYLLEITTNESVQFIINLITNINISNIDVNVHFYKLNESDPLTVSYLGNALITESIMSFQKDLNVGFYTICVSSKVHTFNGIFKAIFTGYQTYAKFKFNFYNGNEFEFETYTSIEPKTCNKVLNFDIIEGSLPPNLIMTDLGNIEGVLPNLDCIDDNKDLSPSQNWFFEMDDVSLPIGRQWRFKVKVWIRDYPLATAEEWFCISVNNNWSWDRDNFQPPFENEELVDLIQIDEDTVILKSSCCEADLIKYEQNKNIQLKELTQPCDCEKENEYDGFINWYEKTNTESNNDEINNFIKKFKESSIYKDLLVKSGLKQSLLTEDEIDDLILQELYKEYENNLIDGRNMDDIDYIMNQLKIKLNQSLPINIVTTNGTSLIIALNSVITDDDYDDEIEY